MPRNGTDDGQRKIIVQNRKARHLYAIEETFEAGLVLKGTEVKSLRMGHGSLAESFALAREGEVYINNFHISPYEKGNIHNVDPVRPRKLLLHKSEIETLIGAVSRKGYSIIPMMVYFKKGRVKVEIGLGRGKKLHDKREDIKKRDQEREVRREHSRSMKG